MNTQHETLLFYITIIMVIIIIMGLISYVFKAANICLSKTNFMFFMHVFLSQITSNRHFQQNPSRKPKLYFTLPVKTKLKSLNQSLTSIINFTMIAIFGTALVNFKVVF